MSEFYKAVAVGRDDSVFHPCAIDVELITPTRFRIVYQHHVVGDHCTRCGESVDWKKIRQNTAPVDGGTPDA